MTAPGPPEPAHHENWRAAAAGGSVLPFGDGRSSSQSERALAAAERCAMIGIRARAVGQWRQPQVCNSHNACNSRMSVCFLTRATCKNVRHESYTSCHCLTNSNIIISSVSNGKYNFTNRTDFLQFGQPEVRRSSITTTVWEESQVTPQGHHL